MKKILIIDDCKVTVETLRSSLLHHGYDVDFVHDGVAGLARVESYQPDLVILDIIMPGMDGLSTLYKIRNSSGSRDLPIIIHSSKSNMRDLFLDKGITAFIDKPFDENQLVGIIRSTIG